MADDYKPFPTRPILNGAAVHQPAANSGEFGVIISSTEIIDDMTSQAFVGTNFRFFEDTESYRGTTEGNSAVGADAVVYYEAETNRRHAITGLQWGYNDAPTNGYVSIESPSGTIVWGPHPVTASGPGFHMFNEGEGITGGLGSDLIIRLGNGGAGVSGQVQAATHKFW